MTNAASATPHRFMSAEHHHGGVLYRILYLRCAADLLPTLFYTVVTQGKIAVVALLGVYSLLLSLFLPFWLLSFVVTEWGVYALAIGTVFLVGRAIVRVIAFPGASTKVVTDIEREFAKYSVRMIAASCQSLVDLTILFEPREQVGEQKLDKRTLHQLPAVWRRVTSHRDRILGVFVDVLRYIYQQDSVLQLSLSVSSTSSDGATSNVTGQRTLGPGLTRYGNNQLKGDVGDFATLPTKARTDGRDLLNRLERVLQLIDDLSRPIKPMIDFGNNVVTEQTRVTAGNLKDAASELRDFVASLKPVDEEATDGEDPTHGVRRKMDEQGKTPLEAVKMALGSILPMLDPPPHDSIFGFDVLRGCMLSRYRGARQLWVRRPTGGMIDVLHFPAPNRSTATESNESTLNDTAVLYCNPNAGLIEVAAGMSLTGGNVPSADSDNARDDSWVDYYTEQGIDVYVFNYAGYGRSYGTTVFSRRPKTRGDQYPGFLCRLGRIFQSALYAFQPTPDTLRQDGVTVASYLLLQGGIEHLVVHGESIGGVSASGTARYISQSPIHRKLSLLICDRTFCNLEAIAQRLVGGWTGYAIRCLTPMWNTDVAGDYLAATCPKVLASDAADVIIAEPSSLKSGVALWKELHRGISPTKGIGWVPETPLQYRMADWENCCVNESQHVPVTSLFHAQAPIWPRDKHVSFEEAFHFAACCKRIGRLATLTARASSRADDMEQNNVTDSLNQPVVVQAWATLGCCDGLTGATLGVATKRGFDATVTWLCACLVFGGQVVVERAERRMLQQQQGSTAGLEITPTDFDDRPPGFQDAEQDATVMFPKPIPMVLEMLVSFVESGDGKMAALSHEFQYVISVLHYIEARLSAPVTIQLAQKSRQMDEFDESGVGAFLNLSCGHNNAFSKEERANLQYFLERSTRKRDGLV